ncbi:hypothetical protein [Calderihabitans maritimus]|uniref:PD-(D/E)XK endonuclease-like domain-containing protein n=1 Tax=Calderihabitans maritimus TaxID=1246530 RepID=A0A1Z5HSK8_9FIRM|nr:hypothetical protein [Calderihabitans maritimus]GAW92311.1 hypothetical protein KKC1_14670 [Calderihabitans maritimus]
MKPFDFFIVGLLVGCLLIYNISKYWQRYRLKRKLSVARRAEKEAVKFLEANGYHIIDVQKRVPVRTYVDGKAHLNSVVADLVVRKNGRTYVVEVKSGKQARRVTSARTRRQLLEYFLIYRPDGILLLDMENRQLREVAFQVRPVALSRRRLIMSHALALAVGIALATIFFWLDSFLGFQFW